MADTRASPGFLELALSGGTPRRSLLVALVVGTVLVCINQGDALLAGSGFSVWKAALTYCVPYLVSTWGAVGAKRQFAAELARRGGTSPDRL